MLQTCSESPIPGLSTMTTPPYKRVRKIKASECNKIYKELSMLNTQLGWNSAGSYTKEAKLFFVLVQMRKIDKTVIYVLMKLTKPYHLSFVQIQKQPETYKMILNP